MNFVSDIISCAIPAYSQRQCTTSSKNLNSNLALFNVCHVEYNIVEVKVTGLLETLVTHILSNHADYRFEVLFFNRRIALEARRTAFHTLLEIFVSRYDFCCALVNDFRITVAITSSIGYNFLELIFGLRHGIVFCPIVCLLLHAITVRHIGQIVSL